MNMFTKKANKNLCIDRFERRSQVYNVNLLVNSGKGSNLRKHFNRRPLIWNNLLAFNLSFLECYLQLLVVNGQICGQNIWTTLHNFVSSVYYAFPEARTISMVNSIVWTKISVGLQFHQLNLRLHIYIHRLTI